MTITSVSFARIGATTRVFATSDLAGRVFFHWYLDGSWLAATTSPWKDFQLSASASWQERVDVLDTTDPSFDPIANAPAGGAPARRSLWWVRSLDEDAAYYVIEQKEDAGSFEVVGRVVQATDAWSMGWLSDRLEDLVSYTWRVTPYDRAGNAGTATTIGPETVVRRPDAPDFEVAFDDATDFATFSEAEAT